MTAATVSNHDIRQALAGRCGRGDWASGNALPPPGIPPSTPGELWALLDHLACDQEDLLCPPQTRDMTVLVRSATYQRSESAAGHRQWWAVIAALRPDRPRAPRLLCVHTYANSIDQRPGVAFIAGDRAHVPLVIAQFNDLLAAKRADGFRARRRSGPGSVTFAQVAAAASLLPRRP